MAELGTVSVIVALALSAYSAIGNFIGGRLNYPELVVSARRATYMTLVALLIGTFTLVSAFLTSDFSIRYVAEHSNLAMPKGYTWVAFYAGNEGSLLYVALALALMASLTVRALPKRLGILLPYSNGVLMLILTFYLLILVTMANPFSELLEIPTDGQGINPLLTHPGMFIHPPMIMLGLISTAVPFSLSIAALLSKKIDDDWVEWGRTWGLIAWVLLGIGLLLGAWWAYTILGWGGYWAWDPVENAALMPWLGLTAFIHSIMVQKRRGMFRMWNLILINITFTLGNFGVFINRGGPVPSVHSFGASPLGWVFLTFLAVTTFASFALFFYRIDLLKNSRQLESFLSREASFLVNNLLLLAIAFTTLWGVVFPLLSELTTGETITVAAPFYNQINGPLLLALVFFMGIGPLLPWRRATWKTVRSTTAIPVMICLMAFPVFFFLGITQLVPILAFSLCTLVIASVLQEWVRGTSSRRKSTGNSYISAFFQLIKSNRPRYGGYIVHIAIVMLTFGIVASSFFDQKKDVILSVGERASIGKYEVQFIGTNSESFQDRTERTAVINVLQEGQHIDTITAWQAEYPSFQMISTRAAIRSTPVEDLYVLFSELQADGETAAFRLMVNPLVWWMWWAGAIVIVGTTIALWPSGQKQPEPTV